MNFQILRKTFNSLLLSALWLVGLSTPFYALAEDRVHRVSIDAMKFSPEVLEVKAGDRIVWENKDPFPHNITSSGGKIHSPNIDVTKTWEFIPRKKGTYAYVCSLHPTMKATLIVK